MTYYPFLRESLTLALMIPLFVILIVIMGCGESENPLEQEPADISKTTQAGTIAKMKRLSNNAPAAPSSPAEQETYKEGATVPVLLSLSNPIATGFTVEWEARPGSETDGTPADASDYSVAFGSRDVTPEDGLSVKLGDILLIHDNVVEGPEIFCIDLTGVFNTAPGVDPTRITLGAPRCITILDNPLPPNQNGGDEEENWESRPEETRQTGRDAYCPVGWKKQDAFGNPTPRVILHAIEVAIDINDRSGIYKPVAIEIYADPTEGLINLRGWKLTVGPLHNRGRDYLLTAENSTFNENSIARIESPAENPFLMNDIQFSGQWLPGFDYRLFDENNARVDFGISCYRHTGLQERLESMETPRVERDIMPPVANDEVLERVHWRERLDWKNEYYLSVWLVDKFAPAVPEAPAAVRKPLTTSWAALKQR